MNKELIKNLNLKRNELIDELHSFKRSDINRKHMNPSHFSVTINYIKGKIKAVDNILDGHKTAKSLTEETKTLHTFNCETGEIEAFTKSMYAVFDRTQSYDETLKYDLSNLISIFPDHDSAFDEQRVAQEWEYCKVEVSVKVLGAD